MNVRMPILQGKNVFNDNVAEANQAFQAFFASLFTVHNWLSPSYENKTPLQILPNIICKTKLPRYCS